MLTDSSHIRTDISPDGTILKTDVTRVGDKLKNIFILNDPAAQNTRTFVIELPAHIEYHATLKPLRPLQGDKDLASHRVKDSAPHPDRPFE